MDFNPRSLAGATRNNLLQYRVLKFQSTLPYGSDKRWDYLFGSKAISIHAPLRERLGFGLLLRNTLTHFNPRSLTGATSDLFSTFDRRVISIHAPSRERLADTIFYLRNIKISIHAPSRERLLGCQAGVQAIGISIHAPSRERPPTCSLPLTDGLFQSTLPHGSDSQIRYFTFGISKFQSTLPHGSDGAKISC